jgi:uncharacterized membrane protein
MPSVEPVQSGGSGISGGTAMAIVVGALVLVGVSAWFLIPGLTDTEVATTQSTLIATPSTLNSATLPPPPTVTGAVAIEKSYEIESADVTIVVESDASLMITERLAYAFSGSFSGAYRDIPVRQGESISDITVKDVTGGYQPGGCVELHCSSPPGTYGFTQIPGYVRIVWHYAATDVVREFTIGYVMDGVATAYNDVIDVTVQVWGDQWPVDVGEVTARAHIPGNPERGDVYLWGHPYGIDGSTSLGESGVEPSLVARNVPSESWVELRIVFPTDLVDSTSGARVIRANGLQAILDEELAQLGF